MAVLINGNGNEAIYAQQDADWFASIMGNQTAITAIGSKFVATLEDANTIGVADGVIITQEGRRIQLDVNELDLFDIPAGGQGQTNYYIIGYHLVTGDLSEQYCETFVRLMDNDTDTIPEDTFRSGADEVFVSLYRVTQVNLAITDMELLLPEITTVAQISTNLTDNDKEFKFGYQNGEYGYYKQEGGADTFSPFKSLKRVTIGNQYDSNGEYNVDIAQLLPNDYQKLTKDNFYITNCAMTYNNGSVAPAYNNIIDSYNSSTGTLHLARSANHGGGWYFHVLYTVVAVY